MYQSNLLLAFFRLLMVMVQSYTWQDGPSMEMFICFESWSGWSLLLQSVCCEFAESLYAAEINSCPRTADPYRLFQGILYKPAKDIHGIAKMTSTHTLSQTDAHVRRVRHGMNLARTLFYCDLYRVAANKDTPPGYKHHSFQLSEQANSLTPTNNTKVNIDVNKKQIESIIWRAYEKY